MNTSNRSHRHRLATAEHRHRTSRDDHRSVPRLRPQLLADAVVAGYIHEISVRHRELDSEDERGELALYRDAF